MTACVDSTLRRLTFSSLTSSLSSSPPPAPSDMLASPGPSVSALVRRRVLQHVTCPCPAGASDGERSNSSINKVSEGLGEVISSDKVQVEEGG